MIVRAAAVLMPPRCLRRSDYGFKASRFRRQAIRASRAPLLYSAAVRREVIGTRATDTRDFATLEPIIRVAMFPTPSFSMEIEEGEEEEKKKKEKQFLITPVRSSLSDIKKKGIPRQDDYGELRFEETNYRQGNFHRDCVAHLRTDIFSFDFQSNYVGGTRKNSLNDREVHASLYGRSQEHLNRPWCLLFAPSTASIFAQGPKFATIRLTYVARSRMAGANSRGNLSVINRHVAAI